MTMATTGTTSTPSSGEGADASSFPTASATEQQEGMHTTVGPPPTTTAAASDEPHEDRNDKDKDKDKDDGESITNDNDKKMDVEDNVGKEDNNNNNNDDKKEKNEEEDDTNINININDNDNDHNDEKDDDNKEKGSDDPKDGDGDNNNDDDKENDKEPPKPESQSPDEMIFGGKLPEGTKPAFALLAGIYEDVKQKDPNDAQGIRPLRQKLSVPIMTLPALLGRKVQSSSSSSSSTSASSVLLSKHMIDLGNCRQLSRKHAVIFYCDVYGGTLGNDGGKHPPPGSGGDDGGSSSSTSGDKPKVFKIDNDWSYRYPASDSKSSPFSGHKRKAQDKDKDKDKDKEKEKEGHDTSTSELLPQTGFFAIECLSKNKIIVDGKRIDQGKVAPLHHKSTIKMLTYTLYFLLPEDTNTNTDAETNTNANANTDAKSDKGTDATKTSSSCRTVNIPQHFKLDGDSGAAGGTGAGTVGRDRGSGVGSGGKDVEEDGNRGGTKTSTTGSAALTSPSPAKKIKKEHEWDGKSVTDLVNDFNSAVENDNFDRKTSMISTQILQHAVEECSHDPYLREMCEKENGISRNLLIDWIAKSDMYGTYVNNLLTKLEVKSYQQNLSKAMIRGGYQRIGNAGRHIKWLLPEVVKEEEEDDDDDDDDGDGDGDDNDGDDNDNKEDAEEEGEDDTDTNTNANDTTGMDLEVKKEILESDTARTGDNPVDTGKEDDASQQTGEADDDAAMNEDKSSQQDPSDNESMDEDGSGDEDNNGDGDEKMESDDESSSSRQNEASDQ